MSEETEPETTNGEKPKKKSKRTSGKKKKKNGGKAKLLLIIIAGIFVVLGGGGGAAYYFGLIHTIMGWERPQTLAAIELGKPVVHPLPEIRTDMKTGACRSPFLRAIVHVQLSPEDLSRLQAEEARIMDGVLTHLRDQERQHVVGKAGSERLRFELVQIIDNIIQPARVHTVLFKELIVQ